MSSIFNGNAAARAPRRALLALAALLVLVPALARGQAPASATRAVVRVVNDAQGSVLQVDGRDFLVFGMNWDYFPVGTNYNYSLWNQPDAVIVAALEREMPLLKSMGVNAIRQYTGVPPRWVRYIYEKYGIFTILNPVVGRYGFTIDGVWYPAVDYSNPRMRAALTADVLATVDQFKDTPGVLMWLLGNENNYGLSWSSFEIEALPVGERETARARHLYSLFGEVIRAVKQRDPGVPVAIANGDLQYIDLIAEHCRELDVMGTNVYRGISVRDMYQVVHDKLGTPLLFTEFGADAWNAREMREDPETQARYLLGQWEEIYEQSRGKGRVGNAIGGCIFQWSDGWWKYMQETRLDVHDTNASWPNGGYSEDFVEGENNMNEEWWGLCAKGPADARGLYQLHPRAAYYALQKAFTLDPYAPGLDTTAIRAHFRAISPVTSALAARGDQASIATAALSRVRMTGLRLDFHAISTGGYKAEPPLPPTAGGSFPKYDRLESVYADFRVQPAPAVTGTMTIHALGNVPVNPIDQISYESRGRPRSVLLQGGSAYELQGIERVKLYKAGVSWEDRWFLLDGFYRTGHYHWGYEGDFFGLYREANYGINIDTYNADAPVGVEMTGRRALSGFKLAFGPQLWWGANPTVMGKYTRRIGRVDATLIHQADLTEQGAVVSSNAIPVPPTRKTTLQLSARRGGLRFELGGILSGTAKVDDVFQVAEQSGGTWRILQDRVRSKDALGGKAKLAYEGGALRWYVQGAVMGLVADAGPTAVTTFTNWYLRDTGSGNQSNVVAGMTWNRGSFQFGPNVLWQKPIVGPIPGDVPSPGRPRNVLDDPFAVRANRETIGGELLVCYDPTPATWMWAWDNDEREDAAFAASLALQVRHLPTSMDASIGILADGVTTFAFPRATPPRHWRPAAGDWGMWELRSRIVSRPRADVRLVGHVFYGLGEPNGDDPRLTHRFGADARLGWGQTVVAGFVKFNDWGPYDYHRDYHLTFPLQVMGDVSRTVGMPQWFDRPQTKLGVRALWRSLDQHSPRFVPDDAANPTWGFDGSEWEVRSYLSVAL